METSFRITCSCRHLRKVPNNSPTSVSHFTSDASFQLYLTITNKIVFPPYIYVIFFCSTSEAQQRRHRGAVVGGGGLTTALGSQSRSGRRSRAGRGGARRGAEGRGRAEAEASRALRGCGCAAFRTLSSSSLGLAPGRPPHR